MSMSRKWHLDAQLCTFVPLAWALCVYKRTINHQTHLQSGLVNVRRACISNAIGLVYECVCAGGGGGVRGCKSAVLLCRGRPSFPARL